MKSIKDSGRASQPSQVPGSILTRRRDASLPYARVTVVTGDHIIIECGRLACGHLIVSEVEYLPLSTYPELATIFDGRTWDVDALHALVSPWLPDGEAAR